MKLFRIFLTGFTALAFFTTACDDMLDVDYDNVLLEEDHRMTSPNDTIHSMVGILSELERLAERFVVLGELRGDLLEASATASVHLREIAEFSVSPGNPYADTRDYYSVINRCNLLIDRIDTAIVSRGQKVMYKEFAAAKAIRAWTYLQLALNHGSVKYYEKPLTSIQDAAAIQEGIVLSDLLPKLIADLAPYQDVALPGSMQLGDDIVDSRKLYFPIRMVLGDLYLYNGQYEQAAQAYYDLMVQGAYLSTDNYQSTWEVVNSVFTGFYDSWSLVHELDFAAAEKITMIAGSSELGNGFRLDSLFMVRREMAPTQVAIDNWERQTYYHTLNVNTSGDLRGAYSSYWDQEYFEMYHQMVLNQEVPSDLSGDVVAKYRSMGTEEAWGVQIYRVGLLYLRYAEAINRAGKPASAFAVLKNGLSAQTLANDALIPVWEKTPLASWMNFNASRLNLGATSNLSTIGIHGRGNGNIQLSEDFSIPELSSLSDSILFVEDLILEEMALELAFEGHRFHDLMRIAWRRNDPGFLARKVAAKNEDAAGLEALLNNESNWYLPNEH